MIAGGRRFATVCERFGVPLILNDRPDLVAAVGADGVHLGQDDIGVEQARELLGADRIVGLSTHSPAEIDSRWPSGSTTSGSARCTRHRRSRAGPAVGTEFVAYAAATAEIPFFAIGGIELSTVGAVVAAGAERIAVVRAITGAVRLRARRPGTTRRAPRGGEGSAFRAHRARA